MTISVALCTYNGEKYIKEQLLSILQQETPVDEIIICDDGSSDNTIQIIDDIRENFSHVIHFYHNETSLGVCANFQKAVNLCSGDIIFLSDQDDIWYPNKTHATIEWFLNNPDKNAVFSNATLIDENGTYIPNGVLFDRIGFRKEHRNIFNNGLGILLFMDNNRATGACMAIKKKYDFLPYCSDSILHDEIIAALAIQDNSLGYIEQPLVKYRLHGNNNVGLPSEEKARLRYDKKHLLAPVYHESKVRFWKFELSPIAQRHIKMLKCRNRMLTSKFGLFSIICHYPAYKKTYSPLGNIFFHFDISQKIKGIKKTLFK